MTILIIIGVLIFLLLVGLLVLRFYPSIGKVPTKEQQKNYAEKTQYFYDGQFHNQNKVMVTSSSSDVKGDELVPKKTIPVVKSSEVLPGEEGKLYVSWLGHSSSLVQLGTKNILIDPVFSKRSSPVSFAGPKRFSDVPIEPQNLPDIDILLISHDHYDHLDYKVIKSIDDKVGTYVVPLGVESYLIGWGVSEDKIKTVAWYDEIDIQGIKLVSTPSQHFTARNPFYSNATWWCGYYFADDSHSVYYSGDGGYYEVFEELNARFGKIDLALIECGQYGNGWPAIHMFPEQTVKAAQELDAEWYIPVHWAAYCICNNNWDDSIIRFTGEADKKGIKYATPLIGERVDFDNIADYKHKWWEID